MSVDEARALAQVLGKTPGPNSVALAGQPVAVKELNLDQIADILLVIDRLAEKGLSPELLQAGKKFNPTQLLLKGGRDFREILAIASGQSPAFVGALNLLEAAKLTRLVYQVNKDFFVANQEELLTTFGLDKTETSTLFASIKSLLTSSPAASANPESSPSPSSTPSGEPSPANSAPN